jgi:hypothetical protein
LDADQLIQRIRRLPNALQAAFSAAAIDHTFSRIRSRFAGKEREREVIEESLSHLWEIGQGGSVETLTLERLRKSARTLAPHTEDEPEFADIMYALTAVAAGCGLALGDNPPERLRGVVYGCINAVEHFELISEFEDESESQESLDEGGDEELRFQEEIVQKLENLGPNGDLKAALRSN